MLFVPSELLKKDPGVSVRSKKWNMEKHHSYTNLKKGIWLDERYVPAVSSYDQAENIELLKKILL